jgi:hypothetical protein
MERIMKRTKLGAVGLFIIAGSIAAITACKKSSTSSAAAAATFSDYSGVWNLYGTETAFSGQCSDSQGTELSRGTMTIYSTGTFHSVLTGAGLGNSPSAYVAGTAVFNASSATLTGANFNDTTCGTGPFVGTCTSFTACAGTFTQNVGGSSGTESGTWRMAR